MRLEVRVALDRVIAEQRAGGTYPFIPIIADDLKDLDALPPFARQYQGVRLTADGGGLADLIRVAARLDAAQPVAAGGAALHGAGGVRGQGRRPVLRPPRRDPGPGRAAQGHEPRPGRRRQRLGQVLAGQGRADPGLPRGRAGRSPGPAPRAGAVARGRDAARQRPVRGAGRGRPDARLPPPASPTAWCSSWARRSARASRARSATRCACPGRPAPPCCWSSTSSRSCGRSPPTTRRGATSWALSWRWHHPGEPARRVVGTMRRDYYHLHTDDDALKRPPRCRRQCRPLPPRRR